jgi:hypothetical protein
MHTLAVAWPPLEKEGVVEVEDVEVDERSMMDDLVSEAGMSDTRMISRH